MRRVRIVLWLAMATLAGLAGGLYLVRSLDGPVRSRSATDVARDFISGEFSLTDHSGRPVTERDFQGSWRLVFFGYTHCPDACPTALATIALVLDGLGADSALLQPLFVTVDPDRDTPAVLADYVAAFHPRIVGLTGSRDSVSAAATAYRVYYAKAPSPGGPETSHNDYTMDHTVYFYLMDPEGRYVTVFSHSDPPDKIVGVIRQYLRE